MKKLLGIMTLSILMGISARLQCIEIRLDPVTSHYPLAVTLYTPDKSAIGSIFIKEDTTKTPINVLSKIDDPQVKKAVKDSNKIFMKIKYDLSDDPTTADMTLFEGDVALNSVITVVTTPFGQFQTIGAVKIKTPKSPERNEPNLDGYKYVEKLARKK